jgi:tetratricopeptide (TPR) repeat protein
LPLLQALAKAKRYREVIEEGADSIDDPIVACQVAGCHHVLGNLDAALSTYLLALSNTGSDDELRSMILSNIGTWLDDRKLYSTALTLWRKAATLDLSNPLTYLNMMRRLLAQENDDDARELAETLLARLKELQKQDTDRFRKAAESTLRVLSKAEQMERFRSSTDPKTVAAREALLRLTASTTE